MACHWIQMQVPAGICGSIAAAPRSHRTTSTLQNDHVLPLYFGVVRISRGVGVPVAIFASLPRPAFESNVKPCGGSPKKCIRTIVSLEYLKRETCTARRYPVVGSRMGFSMRARWGLARLGRVSSTTPRPRFTVIAQFNILGPVKRRFSGIRHSGCTPCTQDRCFFIRFHCTQHNEIHTH